MFEDGWASLSRLGGWFGARPETLRVPSYDLDIPSDALENQIGPLVWQLCFEVIKPKLQKMEIWEIAVFSIGIFIGLKIKYG